MTGPAPSGAPDLAGQIASSAASGTRDAVFSDFGEVAEFPETLRALAPRSLVLERGSIERIDALANLPGLERLTLIEIECPDLTPIGRCHALRELRLEDTPLDDLAFLAGLDGLTTLVLEVFPPVRLTGRATPLDLSPLAHLRQLDTLVVEAPGEALTGAGSLGTLPQLRRLSLSADSLDPLPLPLGGAPIEALSLVGLPVTDVGPLLTVRTLQTLNLTGCPVSVLPDMSPLERLTELSLSGTNVSDLAPLAGLRWLRSLSISRCPVRDLSPLSGLKSLDRLRFSDTPVESLLPLLDLPALWRPPDQPGESRIDFGGNGQVRTDLLLYCVGRTEAEQMRNLKEFLEFLAKRTGHDSADGA